MTPRDVKGQEFILKFNNGVLLNGNTLYSINEYVRKTNRPYIYEGEYGTQTEINLVWSDK